MAMWLKKETGMKHRSHYYYCSNDNITLCLSLPYKGDPWGVRLTEGDVTVHKDTFRLEKEGRENPERLAEAKAMAFKIMEDYIQEKINTWEALKSELKELNESRVSITVSVLKTKATGCP